MLQQEKMPRRQEGERKKWSCGDPQYTNIERKIWETYLVIVNITFVALAGKKNYYILNPI